MVKCLDRRNVAVNIFRTPDTNIIPPNKLSTNNSTDEIDINLTGSKSSTDSKLLSKLDNYSRNSSTDVLDIDFALDDTNYPVSDIILDSSKREQNTQVLPHTDHHNIARSNRKKYTRRLDVSNKSLKSIDLVDFHDLEYINCQGNKITDISFLETCIHLTTINLSKNQIEKLIPLNDIPMRRLDLSFNSLEGTIDFKILVNYSDSELGWSSLEYLNLTGNKIRELKNLHCLVNLRTIILDQNFIEDMDDISSMATLQEISLRENKIRSRFDVRRLPLDHLRILRIDACKGLKRWSSRPPHMEILEICDGVESDLPRFELFPLHLKSLTLSWISGLDKLPLNLCDIVPGLEELVLRDNDLNDFRNVLQAIPTTNLKKIDLTGNPLTKQLSPNIIDKYNYAFHIACQKIKDICLQE